MSGNVLGAAPVLVAVNGCEYDAGTLEWAARHALATGKNVDITMVDTITGAMLDTELPGAGHIHEMSSVEQWGILTSAADELERLGVPSARIRTVPLTGNPASVLVTMSEHYSIMVIGNSCEHSLQARLFGTARTIVPSKSACPVVLVPNGYRDTMRLEHTLNGMDDTVDKPEPILCIINEPTSGNTDELIDYAIAVNRDMGNPGILVTVNHTSRTLREQHRTNPSECLNRINTHIKRIRESSLETNVQPVTPCLTTGGIAKAIQRNTLGISLIITETRGDGGITGYLHDSLTQRIIENHPVPLLVHHVNTR